MFLIFLGTGAVWAETENNGGRASGGRIYSNEEFLRTPGKDFYVGLNGQPITGVLMYSLDGGAFYGFVRYFDPETAMIEETYHINGVKVSPPRSGRQAPRMPPKIHGKKRKRPTPVNVNQSVFQSP